MSLHWEDLAKLRYTVLWFRLGHLCGQSLVNFRLCFLTWRWCHLMEARKNKHSHYVQHRGWVTWQCHATKEAMWLHALLNLIGFEKKQPTLISCWQQWLEHAWSGSLISQMTKHIDIQYHYVCDELRPRTQYSHTFWAAKIQQMLLTKPLQCPHFEFLRGKLGIHGSSGNLSTWGGVLEITSV